MSAYKQAVDRIRNHPGFLSNEAFDQKFLLNAAPDSMADFITENGCLITVRHDLNKRFSGRDYLVNIMTEMLVLHVATDGQYSLHRWKKTTPCSTENRLPKDKETHLLDVLFTEAGTKAESI